MPANREQLLKPAKGVEKSSSVGNKGNTYCEDQTGFYPVGGAGEKLLPQISSFSPKSPASPPNLQLLPQISSFSPKSPASPPNQIKREVITLTTLCLKLHQNPSQRP